MSSYFTFTHSSHERTTRSQSSNTLIVPLWNITAGKRTFQYRATTLWNWLPDDDGISVFESGVGGGMGGLGLVF